MPGYYNEDMMGNDASSPSQAESDQESKNGKDKTDQGESTALLPKSILGGKTFDPGEEVVLEIVHVYDDEVEVKYASEKGKKSKEDNSNMDNESGPMKESMSKMEEAYG